MNQRSLGGGWRSPAVDIHNRGAEDLRAQTDRAVERARTGDAAAVRYLYVTHRDSVLRYVRSLLHDADAAEDVTQATFLRLLTRLDRYEAREVPFEAWLLRVARNLALDELRRRRSAPATELFDHDLPVRDECAERFGDVQTAVAGLPEREREVLVLRYVAGLPFADIAERLGIGERDVRARHNRARAGLRLSLGRTVRGTLEPAPRRRGAARRSPAFVEALA